jgi:FKBP-type peptidyl-prolyl cis-trans isomerase
MKIGHIRIAGVVVGIALGGCGEPADLVPVTPPGAYVPKVSPDADPAQALGETAPSTNTGGAAEAKKSTTATKPALATAKGETKTTAGGVKYETLKEGTGPELQSGQKAKMNYEGKLEDGTIFDSTRRSQPSIPRTFSIGVGTLIKGWDEAIPGMKVGEVRKLTIPPQMGYGKSGKGEIPPDSTLIFEVELVGVE